MKENFDTIIINIRDESGDLVAFEHRQVIITLHFRHSKTQYISFGMTLPLSRLNSMGYDNKPHDAWEDYYYAQAFPEESFLQRGANVPFYRGPMLQRGSIARYGKGRKYQNSSKETTERKQSSILR